MDKQKALETALLQIEKQYGKGSIMRLGDAHSNMNISVIPTGCMELDLALGIGGLPRGRIIEMYGPESSGKTTVALHAVAEAQKMGGAAAYIDVEQALDPGLTRTADAAEMAATFVSMLLPGWITTSAANAPIDRPRQPVVRQKRLCARVFILAMFFRRWIFYQKSQPPSCAIVALYGDCKCLRTGTPNESWEGRNLLRPHGHTHEPRTTNREPRKFAILLPSQNRRRNLDRLIEKGSVPRSGTHERRL